MDPQMVWDAMDECELDAVDTLSDSEDQEDCELDSVQKTPSSKAVRSGLFGFRR